MTSRVVKRLKNRDEAGAYIWEQSPQWDPGEKSSVDAAIGLQGLSADRPTAGTKPTEDKGILILKSILWYCNASLRGDGSVKYGLQYC